MADKKQVQKKEFNFSKPRVQAAKADSGSFTSLSIPSGLELFSPKKAKYRLDIMPYRLKQAVPHKELSVGDCHYEKTYYTHRGVGANQDTFCCLRRNWGEKCPICQYIDKERQKPNNSEQRVKDLKEMGPKDRQLWLVKDLEEPDKGWQVWDVSYHLFGKQLNEKLDASDEEDGYDRFPLPHKGLTLKVKFTSESFQGNGFWKCTNIEFVARTEQYPMETVDEVPCLDLIPKKVPYDKLEAIFLQKDEEPDDDAEGETTETGEAGDDEPAPKAPGKKPKPKPPVEDDNDSEGTTEAEGDPDDEEGSADAEDGDGDGDDPDPDADDAPTDVGGDEEDGGDGEGDPDAEPVSEPDEVVKASDRGIELGDDVKHKEHGTCKVVHISGDETALRLKDKKGEVHRGISPADCKPMDGDEDDEPAPKPKPAAKPAPAKKPAADLPFGEDDDEPAPKPKPAAKPAPKPGKK